MLQEVPEATAAACTYTYWYLPSPAEWKKLQPETYDFVYSEGPPVPTKLVRARRHRSGAGFVANAEHQHICEGAGKCRHR